MARIINLTQHRATPEQIAQGVFDPPEDVRQEIQQLLTFEELPDRYEILRRADRLATIAREAEATHAMIGGAMWLMHPLHNMLEWRGIWQLYAFSRREVQEEPQPDGSVKKVSVFRHVGFVQLW